MAADCAEEMAALSLAVVLRECRQMGTALTAKQGAGYLQSQIHPHRNRGGWDRRAAEITDLAQEAIRKSEQPGVRTETEKREIASAWLELSAACTNAAVKYEAEQLEQRPEQEQAIQQEMG